MHPIVPSPDGTTALARDSSGRGEVVLRRRGRDGALELRVNGVFVMDDRHTATEHELAAILRGIFGQCAERTLPGWPGSGVAVGLPVDPRGRVMPLEARAALALPPCAVPRPSASTSSGLCC